MVMPPGRTKPRAHHEFAQQLDLARREEGLSARDLAEALSCDPRSVRRYLTGERRPSRDVVEHWELACHLEHGTLTALRDGSAAVSQEQDERRPRSGMSRSLLLSVAAAVALLVALALLVVLRPFSQPGGAVTREHARASDIEHHFKRSYTGPVWFRVIPTAAHAGQDHRVRLRWGPLENTFTIRRLASRPGTLQLDKTRPDDVTLLVKVDPPAGVDFGEGQPPAGARKIPTRWTHRTSG
jgi:transcriptional regulator with XRE-family HTH domain